jgi:Fe-S-cluster-containing hydrogenase component 2
MGVLGLRPIPERCAACSICELACTFHHTKAFGRRPSSIAVHKDHVTGEVTIAIHETEAGPRRACDLCAGERVPLCVKWCPVGAVGTTRTRP